MKLILEPTDRIETIDGAPYRRWDGWTESGIPVRALIRMVSTQTHDREANALFAAELRALPPVRLERFATDQEG